MNSKIKRFSVFITVLFLFSNYTEAQDTIISDIENKGICYVSEISNNQLNKSVGIFNKFGNLIFGKHQVNLKKPMSVIYEQADIYWISDVGSSNVFRIKDKKISSPAFLRKKNVELISPIGLCKFSNIGILISDSYLNKIFICNEKEKKIQIFTTGLKQPTGIAYSEKFNEIYVVETAAHRISVYNERGELLRTIGKRGILEGEFNYPTFIWVDKLGIIYVIDSLNFRAQILDRFGNIISVFGKQGDGTGNFARPKGIAVDSKGNIYIADALFHVVQIFDRSGNFLYSFGSQGREKSQFWMPSGIFIDENDLIYVADSYNSRVQVFKFTEKDN